MTFTFCDIIVWEHERKSSNQEVQQDYTFFTIIKEYQKYLEIAGIKFVLICVKGEN